MYFGSLSLSLSLEGTRMERVLESRVETRVCESVGTLSVVWVLGAAARSTTRRAADRTARRRPLKIPLGFEHMGGAR